MRVLIAILLTIAFYAVTTLSAAVLFAVGVFLYGTWSQGTPRSDGYFDLAAAFILGALWLLWSSRPRPAPLDISGIEIDSLSQPRVHRLIREVAVAVDAAEPAQVLVGTEANAAVIQPGGVLGFGGRRVLLVGLPLLALLSGKELRAVIAHELGHYSRHDMLFGRWVYAMNATIIRTRSAGTERLRRTLFALPLTLASLPIAIYQTLFLRATAAVYRQQKFRADVFAVRCAGVDAAVSALVKVAGAQAAFTQYWRRTVLPALATGVRPSLTHDFRRYVATGEGAALMSQVMWLGNVWQVDPNDSHPPLAERLARMRALEGRFPVASTDEDDTALAVDLVEDLLTLEDEALPAGADEPRPRRRRRWMGVRLHLLIPGIVLLLLGGLWALQGAGVAGGSLLSGRPIWVVIGSVMAAIGVGLVFAGLGPSVRRRYA